MIAGTEGSRALSFPERSAPRFDVAGLLSHDLLWGGRPTFVLARQAKEMAAPAGHAAIGDGSVLALNIAEPPPRKMEQSPSRRMAFGTITVASPVLNECAVF